MPGEEHPPTVIDRVIRLWTATLNGESLSPVTTRVSFTSSGVRARDEEGVGVDVMPARRSRLAFTYTRWKISEIDSAWVRRRVRVKIFFPSTQNSTLFKGGGKSKSPMKRIRADVAQLSQELKEKDSIRKDKLSDHREEK